MTVTIPTELAKTIAGRPFPAILDPLPDGWPPGEWLYRGIEDFVLQNGRPFAAGPRPNRVRVLVGKILPKGSAVKQTLAGRRRRFWAALDEKVESLDWHRDGSVLAKDTAYLETKENGRLLLRGGS